MKKKRLAILVGSICLLAILVALPLLVACKAEEPTAAPTAPAPEEKPQFTWRLQENSPRAGFYKAGTALMADRIREITGGKFDITVYAPGELIPTPEWLDTLKLGTIELLSTSIAYHSGVMPETLVAQYLPASMRTMFDPYHLVYDDTWNFLGKVQKAYKDDHNLLVLTGGTGMSSQYGVNFTKPISSMKELVGMKIRSYGITSEWLGKAGGSMTWLPTEEIYTAMAMGTVDACTWVDWGHDYDMSLHEVAPYRWAGSGTRGLMPNIFIVNMEAWESLPDDYKWMLRFYAFEARRWNGSFGGLYNDQSKRIMLDYGVTEVIFPQEEIDEWLEIGVSMWPYLAAKSPRSKEWILYIAEWMKAQGYLEEDWVLPAE